MPQKAKPSEGTPQGPVDRGLAAAYFGANSVASALNLPQKRDIPKNHLHSNPALPRMTAKQDISTLRRLGHFYFALTGVVLSLWVVFSLSTVFRNVPICSVRLKCPLSFFSP